MRKPSDSHFKRCAWTHGTAISALLLLSFTSVRADDEGRKVATYEMTGDGASVDGLQPVRVEGLGFVVGLKGTGSSPPPNNYRRMMIEQMKKKDVREPAQWIDSPDTCLVLLRAFIPPGVRKGDKIDVEVWVPPGDDAMSLKGGYLLEAELKEMVLAKGEHTTGTRALPGDALVRVDGPILVMVDSAAGEEQQAAALRKGKILGRGRVLINRDFRLILEDGKQSKQRSRRVAFRVNQRFRGSSSSAPGKPLANPVNYDSILLGLPAEYKYDVERYLQVVRRIPMSESRTFQDRLLGLLESELLDPRTTIESSLRLESLGAVGIPALKEGLMAEHELAKFCSAQSLAYLKDPAGYKVLAELADRSNIYRSYALAGLITRDHPIARSHLVKLLDSESSEARYGAFRSLWVLDPEEPAAQSVTLGPDAFSLHLVETKADPMIHVSRNFRREIVLFHPRQPLLTPLSLRAGDAVQINASAGSQEVHLAAFRAGDDGATERRATSSLSVADVITRAAELGATYPDIVDMLMQASAAKNLAGRLEINALPKPVRLETLEAVATDEGARRWREFSPGTPSLFATEESPESSRSRTVANLGEPGVKIDVEDAEETNEPAEEKKRSIWEFWRRSAN